MYKWKLWCNVDSKWVYTWAPEAPEVCPENQAHGIDTDKTTIVETIRSTTVYQEFSATPHQIRIDGIGFQATADKWVKHDYSLPVALHIQEAWIIFKDCKLGDYGMMTIIHPSSEVNLAESASQGATQVNVGAANAPYFDPDNGAKYIAFWNAAEDELLEAHAITGVSGALVTIVDGLAAARDTTVKVKARYGGYTIPRGTNLLEGGFFLLNSEALHIQNPYSLSDEIAAGMKIAYRVKTTDVTGTRSFVVNMLFRTPIV